MSDTRTVECYGCDTEIEVVADEWWDYTWGENPAAAVVEEAMDDPDFRDWMSEHAVLCKPCHSDVQAAINGGAE